MSFEPKLANVQKDWQMCCNIGKCVALANVLQSISMLDWLHIRELHISGEIPFGSWTFSILRGNFMALICGKILIIMVYICFASDAFSLVFAIHGCSDIHR